MTYIYLISIPRHLFLAIPQFSTDESNNEKTSSSRYIWPKIPSRSEDQLKQSVDSFQLAKTRSRTNPH